MKKVIIVNIVSIVIAILVPMIASAASTYKPVYIDQSNLSSRDNCYNSNYAYVEFERVSNNYVAGFEKHSIECRMYDYNKSSSCFCWGPAKGYSDGQYYSLYCYYIDGNGNLKTADYGYLAYLCEDTVYPDSPENNRQTISETYQNDVFVDCAHLLYTFEDNSRFFSSASISKSNVPVFTTKEACESYLLYGTYDGCINVDEILPVKYGKIEPPQNLRFYLTDGTNYDVFNTLFAYEERSSNINYNFTWSQSDDVDCTTWITEFHYYSEGYIQEDVFFGNGKQEQYSGVYIDMFSSKTNSWKYSISLYEMYGKFNETLHQFLAEKKGYDNFKDFLDDYKIHYGTGYFYVRNKCIVNGIVYYSNFVKVTVGSGSTSAEATELVYPDNYYNENLDKMPGDDFNINDKSDYNGTDILDKVTMVGGVNIYDISSYVKSGFGMLGDNGLIALMSDLFSFIPSWFWTILAAAVSILVVVSLVKLVVKVV